MDSIPTCFWQPHCHQHFYCWPTGCLGELMELTGFGHLRHWKFYLVAGKNKRRTGSCATDLNLDPWTFHHLSLSLSQCRIVPIVLNWVFSCLEIAVSCLGIGTFFAYINMRKLIEQGLGLEAHESCCSLQSRCRQAPRARRTHNKLLAL